MKVVKYICDKCGKEINGSVMAIVPEILDKNNAEPGGSSLLQKMCRKSVPVRKFISGNGKSGI